MKIKTKQNEMKRERKKIIPFVLNWVWHNICTATATTTTITIKMAIKTKIRATTAINIFNREELINDESNNLNTTSTTKHNTHTNDDNENLKWRASHKTSPIGMAIESTSKN